MRFCHLFQIIQVPQGRFKVLAPELTRTGPYPVALIPGQFQEYYKRYITCLGSCFWRLLLPIVLCIISNISLFYITNRYTPNELRYLPLNTALYEPPLDPDLPALDSEPDSDDAEDGKEEKKNKNSSVRYISCNYFKSIQI